MRKALLELMLAVTLGGAPGCGRQADKVSARPPPVASVASARPDACEDGGGALEDPVSATAFPRRVGRFCIDPHADLRSYGDRGQAPLAAGCELLAGDCARYATFGLRRVLIVPYLDGADVRARVSVTLLTFGSLDAAYAFFTERLLSEAEDGAVWSPLDVPGAGALSGSMALAFRAESVALLEFADETAPPGRIGERSAGALTALTQALVAGLPGKPDLPRSAALLPKRDGGPRSLRYAHEDLLGLSGLGAGAVAAYATPGAAFSVAIAARPDEDGAKDVVRTLRRLPGARALREAPYEATSVALLGGESASVQWLFGRKRSVVLGIGEERPKGTGAAADRARYEALGRMKAMLDELRP